MDESLIHIVGLKGKITIVYLCGRPISIEGKYVQLNTFSVCYIDRESCSPAAKPVVLQIPVMWLV